MYSPNYINVESIYQKFFFREDILSDNLVFLEIGGSKPWCALKCKDLLHNKKSFKYVLYEASKKTYKNITKYVNKYPDCEKFLFHHNNAIGPENSELEFYELKKKNSDTIASSSSSLYPRHNLEKKFELFDKYKVKCKSLNNVFRDNNIDHIDVIFSNSEGAETFFIKELDKSHELRNKIKQLCIGYHGRIYGMELENELKSIMLKYYDCYINNINDKDPCYLYILHEI